MIVERGFVIRGDNLEITYPLREENSMRTTAATLIAVLLVWGGPVFAAIYIWDAGGDGTLWTNPANWNPDGVPGVGDVAGIEIDNGGRSITTSVAVTIHEMEMKDFFDETIVMSAPFTATRMSIGPGTLDCNGNDLTVTEWVRLNGTLDAHTGGDPSVNIGELNIRGSGTYNATAGRTTLTWNQVARSTPIYTNGGSFVHNQGTFHLNPGGNGALEGDMTGPNAFYNLVWDFTDGDIQSSIDILHDLTVTQKVDVRFDPKGATTGDIVMTLGDVDYSSSLIGPGGCCGFAFISADGFNLTIQGKSSAFPAHIGGGGGPVMEIFRGADSQTPDELHLGAITIYHPGDPLNIRADSVDLFIDDDVVFELIGSRGLELGSGNTLSVQDNNLTFSNDVAALINLNGSTTTVTTGTILLTGGVTWTNGGGFSAGTSTVVFSNGSSTVHNNGQAFYNLTAAPGGGNTTTLPSGQASAVNGLLHVIDGTCNIPGDNITKPKIGAGAFVELGPFGSDITLANSPQVESGATLRAGLNVPPGGTLIVVK